MTINKTICDEVKNKLKEDSMNFKRYKILVQCIIGIYKPILHHIVEKRGQGIRIGTKSLWDTTSDSAVWGNYENDCLIAFCAAFGVYFY